MIRFYFFTHKKLTILDFQCTNKILRQPWTKYISKIFHVLAQFPFTTSANIQVASQVAKWLNLVCYEIGNSEGSPLIIWKWWHVTNFLNEKKNLQKISHKKFHKKNLFCLILSTCLWYFVQDYTWKQHRSWQQVHKTFFSLISLIGWIIQLL